MPLARPTDATPVEIDTLLEIYNRSLKPLRELTATKQTLSDSEFRELLNYDATWLHVVYSRTGQPAGFVIAVRDLKLIPFINPEFYRRRYPEHYATDRIFYVPALVVDPQYQKGPTFLKLAREMTAAIAPHDAIVAMDCCAHNLEVEQLPAMLEKALPRFSEVSGFDQIDRQTFFAFGLRPQKPAA